VDPRTATTNIAKWLLWDDPLLQPLSPMVDAVNMTGYYRELSTWLSDRVRVRFPIATENGESGENTVEV
jgi:hypothetical protein